MKILLLTACLFLGLTTGCTKKDVPPKGVHLYFQAEPFSFDPRMGGDRRSQVVLRALFEGLTRTGKNGLPELALADRFSLSNDKRTYTFHLRPSLWSNGEKVTAHDFEWAWKSTLEPSFPSPFCFIMFIIKNAKKAHMKECSIDEVGVRALDDSTLEVTLEHPAPYFFELLSCPLFSPLSKTATEENPRWPGMSFPQYVCNGPFRLKTHSLKSEIVLEKNPLYWNTDAAASSLISFSIIEDPNTAHTLFENGDLDWYGDPCGIIPLDILTRVNPSLKKQNVGGLYWLVTCTEKPHLSSPRIREAIATALHRQELTDFINGGEEPAYSILPSFSTMLKKHTYTDGDDSKARGIFAKGCEELGMTPETYPTLTITHWAEPTSKAIAEIIQQQLQNALNINVELVGLDWGSYMKKVPAGEIDIATAPWETWVQDPMFNLEYLKYKNNGINGTKWQNQEYIAELDAADASLDDESRRAHMARAEEIVMEELPLIPMYYLTHKYMKKPSIKGEVITPVGRTDLKWLENTSEGP